MKKQINSKFLIVAMVIAIVFMLSFNANAQKSSCGEADYDCQIKIASKAIQANPQDSESFYARANAYLNKGDYESAIKDYTKTLELNPEKDEVYDNRAAAYYNSKNYAAAIADYTKSIELDSTNPDIYVYRGNAYDDAGNFNAAIKDYNEAIKVNDKLYSEINVKAYFNRGVASLNHGNGKQAVSDFQKVLTVNPENAQAKELLAKAQSAKQEKDAQSKAKWAKFGQAIDQIASNGQNQDSSGQNNTDTTTRQTVTTGKATTQSQQNGGVAANFTGVPTGEYVFMSATTTRRDGSPNVNTNVNGTLILKTDGTYEHNIYIGNSPGGCGPGTFTISGDTLRLVPNSSTGCNAKDWKYIYSPQMNRLSLRDDNVTLLYCVEGEKNCFKANE